MESTEYPQYLSAKKKIDDRSLNRHVWQTLQRSLPKSNVNTPLEVLEIGGGIGTMFLRMVEWQLTPYMNYLLSDPNGEYIDIFWQALAPWCRKKNIEIEKLSATHALISTTKSSIYISTMVADAEQIVYHFQNKRKHHLLVASGVFDLLDIEIFLPNYLDLLDTSGMLYASINYDCRSIFLPTWPDTRESELLKHYHESMERNSLSSSPLPACMSGSRLLSAALKNKFAILAAGSSDWLVHPKEKYYAEDETLFLRAILETIWLELRENKDVDQIFLKDWLLQRQNHLNEGKLIFSAKNLDMLLASPMPKSIKFSSEQHNCYCGI